VKFSALDSKFDLIQRLEPLIRIAELAGPFRHALLQFVRVVKVNTAPCSGRESTQICATAHMGSAKDCAPGAFRRRQHTTPTAAAIKAALTTSSKYGWNCQANIRLLRAWRLETKSTMPG
jgi:hypothetical protein